MPMLDSHTHIDLQEVSVAEALAQAAAVNITRVVQVGIDVPTSRWGAEQAAAQPSGTLLATVAIHPNEAPRLGADDPAALDAAIAEINALAAAPAVRGIGETGLDYFRTPMDGRALQQHSFREHIAIAQRYDKALMIHDRDAHDDVLRILAEEGAPRRVIFHCFSGDAEFAKQCAAAGYYMSFAGNITFKNAGALREAAKVAPRELLLVETDGPFLTPEPYRGRPNGPYLIPLTLRFLAQLRDEDVDQLAAAIWQNGERVFIG